MKLYRKQPINHNQADQLIARYYDGLTTVAEEKQLRAFLCQANLPEQYDAEKAMFGYFGNLKQAPTFSIQPYIKWASAAAVILVTVISVQLFTLKNKQNFAYINGEKTTDIQEIKSQALASLSEVSTNNVEVENGINDITNHLPEQELNVFAGLEQ